MPSGADYEELFAALVRGLRQGSSLAHFHQASGTGNRHAGASGYRHQIDLSLASPSDLYLFELKCLNRSIGVEEVLVLASRRADIAAANPGVTVHASMVSLRRPSKNVPRLAGHFQLELAIVEDIHSYGVSFSGSHFVGHVERANATDSCDAVVTRGGA
jgi:hypothetical protein